MSKPSYKNLLKRSRSSIDPVTDREDILQGIALACKARTDGTDVLRFLKGRALHEVSSVSQIARVVTESSIANNLFFSPDTVRAVTLARSPSYPFDMNKALIRCLLADMRDGEGYSMQAGRRRKCVADHDLKASAEERNVDRTGLPPSFRPSVYMGDSTALLEDETPRQPMHAQVSTECASVPYALSRLLEIDRTSLLSSFPSSLMMAKSGAPAEDENPRKPMHVQGSTECASAQAPSARGPLPDALPDVINVDVSSSRVLEKVEVAANTVVNDAALPCLAQDSSERVCADLTGVETSLVANKACCISRDKCPQFGLLSVCGRRREMEDTHTVEPDLVLLPCDALGGCHCSDGALCACSSFHFFGVYDGHGGTQASAFCKVRLHKALIEELIKEVRSYKKAVNGVPSDWSARWRRVMEACFLKIDEEVGGVCLTGECSTVEGNPNCCVNPIAPDNVGTTAVVAVLGPCQIIVGNCGDSRAVLSRGGNAVPLSRDHKPDREDEMNRIIAAGGRIIYWDGYRVGGLLAMSRAIGDRFLKKYVVAVPEVTCIERTKEDECLILASDGLWDVVSSEMACDIARRRLRSQRRKCAKLDNPSAEDTPAGAAAALLTKLALSRGSKDNISVIVIDLKAYSKKSL